MNGRQRIKSVEQGDAKRTMMRASLANEVIDFCNLHWTIKLPQNASGNAVVMASEQNVVIDLSQITLGGYEQPEIHAINGVLCDVIVLLKDAPIPRP